MRYSGLEGIPQTGSSGDALFDKLKIGSLVAKHLPLLSPTQTQLKLAYADVFCACIALAAPGRPEILRVGLDSFDRGQEMDAWSVPSHLVRRVGGGGEGGGQVIWCEGGGGREPRGTCHPWSVPWSVPSHLLRGGMWGERGKWGLMGRGRRRILRDARGADNGCR